MNVTIKNENTRKILVLMFMIPVLSELLSGSSTIVAMVNPIHLLIQVLSYGVPAVLIREYSIRWGLGLKGLLLLGIAYGILNEGVLAQTFSDNKNLLGELGSQYFIFGLHPFWVVFISVWHAFFAVLFPIFFVNKLYPGQNLWLGKKSSIWFLIIVVLGMALGITVGDSNQAIIATILIILFVILAKIQKVKIINQVSVTSLKPFWVGFTFILYLIGAIILAKVISFPLFVVYEFFGLFLFYRVLKRYGLLGQGSLILFGAGAYVSLALFVIIIFPSPVVLLPNSVIIIWVIWFTKKVFKKEKENTSLIPVRL